MSGIAGLGGEAARGVAWSLASAGAVRVVSFVTTAVLARLLVPAEFGVLGAALVFVGWLETVGDFGAGAALVYWRERERKAAQASFLLNLLSAALWFAVAFLLAPAVAGFFRTPEAGPVLRALALSFPLKALGSTHDALARRRLAFRSRLAPELGQVVVKGAVALGLARAGFGVWSLVAGHLAGLVTWSALLWAIVPWRPAGRVPRDLIRPMLGYGRGIVAINVLAAVVHHFDAVVVGRRLGAEALGLYQMAARVPEMTIAVLLWAVSAVLFPAFSRLAGDRERLGAAWLEALRWVALATLPLAAGLALLARPLVVTAFGPAWAGSAPVLAVLAGYFAVRSLGTHAGDVLKATGRTGLLARLGLLRAAVLVPALWWAAGRGAVAVAATMAIVTALAAVLNFALLESLVGAGARAALRAAAPGLAVAAATALGGGLGLLAAAGWSEPARLALAGPVSLLAAAAGLRLVAPGALGRARSVLLARHPAAPAAGGAQP